MRLMPDEPPPLPPFAEGIRLELLDVGCKSDMRGEVCEEKNRQVDCAS